MSATLHYVAPPTFEDNQVLGRCNTAVLVDNDDYFNGLGDRQREIPTGVVTGWQSDTVARLAWDGYHLHRTDMDTFYYYASIDNASGGDTTLAGFYDYGGAGQVTMFSISGDNTASGSISLAAFDDDGLYRVVFLMTRSTTSIGATATVRAPYSVYTGSLSYTSPPTISDSAVGTAAQLNIFSANDRYFNAVSPSQSPCAGMYRSTTSTEVTHSLYDGWDKFHPDHYRLYYSVYLEKAPGSSDVLTIYYDSQSTSISADGESTGYWDFSTGGLTKGNWYQVRVVLDTDTTAGSRAGAARSVRVGAPAMDSSYTVMDEIYPNEFVYGSTGGQATRLALLSSNDAAIRDRLCWGASSPVKLDFAVRKPEFRGFAGWYFYGNYNFVRRGDFLYYRTIDGLLVAPDGSTEVLQDYDDDNPYQILSLSGLDLPHGAEYTIRRVEWDGWDVSKATPIANETLEFALEI